MLFQTHNIVIIMFTMMIFIINTILVTSPPSILRPGFYSKTCPKAETIVRDVMKKALLKEPRSLASVMRFQFHDCFVNGCDASMLLDDTPTMLGEKLALSNINSLRSFEVVDKVKEALEKACPGVVSCADIIIMASRDAVALTGGPDWEVKLGRLDSLTASQEDSNKSSKSRKPRNLPPHITSQTASLQNLCPISVSCTPPSSNPLRQHRIEPLQHLVTFGIVDSDDLQLYCKLVIASAWRKHMPKLALSLGLSDQMPDMIEELISKGQQLDAVHFTFEVGLVDKFPPVPLLKSFLKDAKKVAASILEDPNDAGRASYLAARKEQYALKAVIKCIEEYKLEVEFPAESLKKRLEQLEKIKPEKRKQVVVPANKRTRASNSNGGHMPPAKAGRLTNAYVSSFHAAPTFVRSPSHGQYPAALPPYPSPPHMYGSRSPSYAYSPSLTFCQQHLFHLSFICRQPLTPTIHSADTN